MDYLISKEQAIPILRNLQDWLYFSGINGGTKIQREAIDVAIVVGASRQLYAFVRITTNIG